MFIYVTKIFEPIYDLKIQAVVQNLPRVNTKIIIFQPK